MHNYTFRKKWIPIIVVILAVGYVSYDLFREQQQNSKLLNSGTMINPVTIGGRAACEVPIPDITTRSQPDSLLYQEKDFLN